MARKAALAQGKMRCPRGQSKLDWSAQEKNNLQTQSERHSEIWKNARWKGRGNLEVLSTGEDASKKAVGTLQTSNEASNRSARHEVVVEEEADELEHPIITRQ